MCVIFITVAVCIIIVVLCHFEFVRFLQLVNNFCTFYGIIRFKTLTNLAAILNNVVTVKYCFIYLFILFYFILFYFF